LLVDLLAGDDLPAVLGQQRQQFDRLRRQLHERAIPAKLGAAGIELEGPEAEDR
jgi:hypothetical protein